MYRLMVKYEMTPEVMEEWLKEWPNFLEVVRAAPTKMVIEDAWVSKDRTQFFFIRTLESAEANRKAVDEAKVSE